MGLIIKKEELASNQGNAILSKRVKDASDDPFFVNKAKEATITLEKYGFPILNETTMSI